MGGGGHDPFISRHDFSFAYDWGKLWQTSVTTIDVQYGSSLGHTIGCKVIRTLSVAQPFHWIITNLTTLHKHAHAFVPFLHEFKNSVTVKIGLLHSQPFMNNDFHFTIIVELVTSQILVQKPKKEDGQSLSIQQKQLQ
jgi:hypothetical protein